MLTTDDWKEIAESWRCRAEALEKIINDIPGDAPQQLRSLAEIINNGEREREQYTPELCHRIAGVIERLRDVFYSTRKGESSTNRKAFNPRSEFGISPEQYHAGLDKLWNALAGIDNRDADVFTQAANAIKSLRAQRIHAGGCITKDGKPYGPGSKVYYRDPTGYIQGLDVGVSFRTDSSAPEPVYHPYPVYSSREAADEASATQT